MVIVATLVVWQLPTPPSDDSPQLSKPSRSKKFSRIDIPGSILLFCTIASLLLVLDLGGKKLPMDSPIVIGLICATVALAISFVLVEAYTIREPVFPLRLAVSRDIATAYGAAGLQLAAEFGVWSLANTTTSLSIYIYKLGNIDNTTLLPSHAERESSRRRCTPSPWSCRIRFRRITRWRLDSKVRSPASTTIERVIEY